MEITLLAFASASDAFGFSHRSIACEPHETPLGIVRRIAPDLETRDLRVALDQEFVTWETAVGTSRELAFIPPVSGG